MKDEYGNGLTADNIATLDNASVAHNRIVTQKTNQTIGSEHEEKKSIKSSATK